ncbi:MULTISPECIES: DUF2483 family protein [unclassified Mammaliicoccus]|uniref:DUF2483 family protein n=1 Tax=unclassified Mammaliicoccus TaxID=2803851 RepID=UPI001EFADBEF|nr:MULTISPECIES: DUF2483 family protein [unclassified Mammaliicoccus]
MAKETITYIISKDNLWVTNRPSKSVPTIKYSTSKSDARKFDGLEDLSIDLTNHRIFKITHIEIDEEEEIKLE